MPSSGNWTRMTTVLSVSMSPKEPRSTRSEKPVTMRENWARSGSVACSTRGIRKNRMPAMTNVPPAAARLTRIIWPRRPRRVTMRSRRPAWSDSVTMWFSIIIHVARAR